VRKWTLEAEGSDVCGDKAVSEKIHATATAAAARYVKFWQAAITEDDDVLSDWLISDDPGVEDDGGTPVNPGAGDAFDRLMEVLASFHLLTPLSAKLLGLYIRFACTCKLYQDKGACKHSVYEGLKCGLFKVPAEKDFGCIGRHPKKGRPKKTVGRRERQPGESSLDPLNPTP
jgi:hypothetical protein